MKPPTRGLSDLLDRLDEAGRGERVSLGDVVQAMGRRSFAPVLLLAGLIVASPLSGIPGVPTITALLVLLVAGQMLTGRTCCWLPAWLNRRSISHRRFEKAVGVFRRPARFVDRHVLRQRLTALTSRGGAYAIGLASIVIALAMPPMELVPFASSIAGVALMLLALALVADDGLLVLVGSAFVACGAVLVVRQLL